ncbi:MAG TPA: ABC transporter substrate-binding protein, partial [Gemmatimonadaceae bacterium]|nr:ABC transporter substrate-binding protein [Gemmatimonadaceae bacterium]
VRALAAAGAPVFALDEARIAALRPDVVLTQQLCEVCAVSETDVRRLAATLASRPAVVTLGGTTLAGVLDDVERVAAALGAPERGATLRARVEERMRRVHETLRAARAPRPRVAVIEWTEPVFAAGHWVPEMVRRAGGADVLAVPGRHSVTVEPAAVERADPQVLLVAPCGYDVTRAAAAAERLLARPEWAWALERRVWVLDANALVSRPGPRLADGVEVMAALFAPGLFAAPSPEQARRIV